MYQPNYADQIPQVYAEAIDEVRREIFKEMDKFKDPTPSELLCIHKEVLAAVNTILKDILNHYYQEDWCFTLERARGCLEKLKKWRPNCADRLSK